MSLKPVPMTTDEMADLLEDMARTVRARDSFGGSIQFDALVDDVEELKGRDYLVSGVYRIGNSMGQGGTRMIGTVEPEDPSCG